MIQRVKRNKYVFKYSLICVFESIHQLYESEIRMTNVYTVCAVFSYFKPETKISPGITIIVSVGYILYTSIDSVGIFI